MMLLSRVKMPSFLEEGGLVVLVAAAGLQPEDLLVVLTCNPSWICRRTLQNQAGQDQIRCLLWKMLLMRWASTVRLAQFPFSSFLHFLLHFHMPLRGAAPQEHSSDVVVLDDC